MEIVFFDSGVGGLTVLSEAIKIMPHERFLYYADTDNVPYGIRDRDEIRSLVFEAVEKLDSDKIKALVLACNTATSVAVNALREKYSFPIIGMEPAVKPASEIGDNKVLICATDSTLKQNKLLQLIDDLNVQQRIEMMSLQDLVMYAEYFNFKEEQIDRYLDDKFKSIHWDDFDAIVLGCTHFLFYKRQLEKIVPRKVKILDGNYGTVNRLESLISKSMNGEFNLRFMKSGRLTSYLEFDHFLRYYKEQQNENY